MAGRWAFPGVGVGVGWGESRRVIFKLPEPLSWFGLGCARSHQAARTGAGVRMCEAERREGGVSGTRRRRRRRRLEEGVLRTRG